MKKVYYSPEFEFKRIEMINDVLEVSVSQPQSEETLPEQIVTAGNDGPDF